MSKKYNEIPLAGNIIEPGNSENYLTGTWRSERPVIDESKCLWTKHDSCLKCFVYCPDSAIIVRPGHIEVKYSHCKGCGICAHECPVKCIDMVPEV